MDFDEFDAPQFVDFSKENFDAAHEGDSWFSSDSSASDFEVEELEELEEPGETEEEHLAPKGLECLQHERQVRAYLIFIFVLVFVPSTRVHEP